jgi:hypothetical protein
VRFFNETAYCITGKSIYRGTHQFIFQQRSETMNATNMFFNWYFQGLGGFGGWVLFFVFALIAIAYIIADSQWRKIRGAGLWLLGAILLSLLILPTILFRFSSQETQLSMIGLKETFFYMGVMGGIFPLVVALGYAVAFWGKDNSAVPTRSIQPLATGMANHSPGETSMGGPKMAASRSHPTSTNSQNSLVNAWLINEGNRKSYQLKEGDTRIGRDDKNEVMLSDSSVSRDHALIREDRGHFIFIDRGSKSGSYVNKRKVEAPFLLSHGDAIEVGDQKMKFVTSL